MHFNELRPNVMIYCFGGVHCSNHDVRLLLLCLPYHTFTHRRRKTDRLLAIIIMVRSLGALLLSSVSQSISRSSDYVFAAVDIGIRIAERIAACWIILFCIYIRCEWNGSGKKCEMFHFYDKFRTFSFHLLRKHVRTEKRKRDEEETKIRRAADIPATSFPVEKMCSHWPSAVVRCSQRVGIWSAFFFFACVCVRVHLLRFHVMGHNSSSIFILLISKSRNIAAVADPSVRRNHFVACLFMPLSTIYWPVKAIATHTQLQLPTVTECVFVFIRWEYFFTSTICLLFSCFWNSLCSSH